MRFAVPRLASNLPQLATILSLGLTAACGDKGADDDPATQGEKAETVFAFDSGIEGFKFEAYDPGEAEETTYDNIASTTDAAHPRTAAEAAENAKIEFDAGNGPDGKPGRLKLSMNFTNWNQLADIQINFMGEEIKDWSGKKLTAKVMLETGFSPDPSCPGGTYLFAKTGAEWVWAKGGQDIQLTEMSAGQWQTVPFIMDLPGDNNPGYDAVEVRATGLQFYSNSGSNTCAVPAPAVVYVDDFVVEDAM